MLRQESGQCGQFDVQCSHIAMPQVGVQRGPVGHSVTVQTGRMIFSIRNGGEEENVSEWVVNRGRKQFRMLKQQS